MSTATESAEPGTEHGTALERSHRQQSITQRRRTVYDVGQLDLIKSQVMHTDATDGELAVFLELCARYELDPFAKQVWSIKIKGKVQTVVAHAGLLSLAERHTPSGIYAVEGAGQFKGCAGDVIRQFDHFRKVEGERDDETAKVVIEHEYRNEQGEPTHGGADGSLRGPIIGSWGRVRREGFDDRYFLAYWASYNKAGATTDNAWKTHPDFMMLKCAQTVALRQAFSVSGVVGAEELGMRTVEDRLTAGNGTAGGGDVEWPEDEELTAKLREAFQVAGWTKAKQRMHVNGKTEAELLDVLHQISVEMDMAAAAGEGGDQPPGEPEPEPADADVVEE